MSKNRCAHTIPMKKGFVHGYYEKRNGRLVWISPYENSKGKQQKAGDTNVFENPKTGGPDMPAFDDGAGKVSPKPIVVQQINEEKFNFLLEAVVRCVRTIDTYEPGEIVKLKHVLQIARSIVSELGYLDASIAEIFQIPDAKQTRLGSKAVRETTAMAKELKRLSRRVTQSTLRAKVQKMSLALEEAS